METAQEVINAFKLILSGKKFNQIQLTDKSYVEFLGETLTLGTQPFQVSGNNRNLCPDGIWKSLDGKIEFTVSDGKVSVLTPNLIPVAVETPVLQAQSSQEEIPATEVTEVVKESVELADAGVTVDISTVINAAISPVWDAIYKIQSAIENLATLYVSQENFSEVKKVIDTTNTALNGIVETVEILANQPSAAPIEKEVINLSTYKVPTDIKDSINYKAMQLAFKK